MATDVERLVVQLSADVKKYENALNRAMGVTNQRTKAIESRFERMNKNISASFSNTLRAGAAIAGGVFSTNEIMQYADAWTQAGNMIAAAAQSAGVQTRSLEDLRKGADEARTSLETYTDLYARLIRSASGVAKSEEEIALATSLVSKAMKAGGASTQEQAASILQLGQALGSGVLQGDELRSLRENAPIVAKAIADEFGVTVAGLKKLGEQGKLTSDRVFRAIINAQKPIEAQFAKTNATIGDGFTLLKNSVTEYIGQTADAYGVTQTLNTILAALAGNISSVAAAAAAAGVTLLATFGRGAVLAGAAALLNPFVALAAAIGAAAYAVSEFWDEIVPLENSVATLGDYIVTAWDQVAAKANELKATVVGMYQSLIDNINSALQGAGTSIDGLLNSMREFVNSTAQLFFNLKDGIAVAFGAIPDAIMGGVVSAMNSMTEVVVKALNVVIRSVNKAIEAINSIGEFAGIGAIDPFNEIDEKVGQLPNTFKTSAEEARKEFDRVMSRPPVDYVGQVIDAAKKNIDEYNKEVDADMARWTQLANERARQRSADRKDADLGGSRSSTSSGYGGGVAGADSGGRKGRSGGRENEYEREIQQIKERTAALHAETAALAGLNPLINDYGYSTARAKAAQELLSAAQKAGTAAGKELKDVQQLLRGEFDGLSPAARTQAQAMLELATNYGVATEASERFKEKQDEIRERAEQAMATAKDITRGMIDGFIEGERAADIFANSLKKIGNALIDDVLNSIFQVQNAAGGGFLSGLFNFGGGSFPAAPTVGLYAGGGYTGPGGKNQPAGIVHKGEVVFSQADVARMGGVAAVEALRRGYADGGPVGVRAPTLPKLAHSTTTAPVVVNFSPTINAPGADATGLAQVRQELHQMKREIGPLAVQAIQSAKKRNVQGI